MIAPRHHSHCMDWSVAPKRALSMGDVILASGPSGSVAGGARVGLRWRIGPYMTYGTYRSEHISPMSPIKPVAP
jgi:hypothetical protein